MTTQKHINENFDTLKNRRQLIKPHNNIKITLLSTAAYDRRYIYIRGRQSPARGPNPAREFRPSGPRWLGSFNIKFGPENVPNDERLFSR